MAEPASERGDSEQVTMLASQAEKKKQKEAAEVAAALREEGTMNLAMRMLDKNITLNMMFQAGYTVEDINRVVGALFLDQSDKWMRPAWCNRTGQIGTRELEKALRLMQENITTDKIERLFAEADTDGSGWIEYDEFKALMAKMNPLQHVKKSHNSLTASVNVSMVLDRDIQLKLHPLQKEKSGRIIKKMLSAGYTEMQVNAVCRALFMGKSTSDPCWKSAFEVFDADGSGSIDAAELKAAFPLMGEKMSEQRMKQLFAEADADGSGEIEFEEFVPLMRHLNPKPAVGAVYSQHSRDDVTFDESMLQGETANDAELLKWLAEVELLSYEKHFRKFPVKNFDEYAEMPFSNLARVLGLRGVEASTVFDRVRMWYYRKKHAQMCSAIEDNCQSSRASASLARERARKIRERTALIANDQDSHRSHTIQEFQATRETHPVLKRRRRRAQELSEAKISKDGLPAIKGAIPAMPAVSPIRDEMQFPKNGIIPPAGYVGHARGVGRPSIFRGHGIANISGNVPTPYIWRNRAGAY